MEKSIKLSVRLGLGFSALLALMIVMIVVALINFRSIDHHLQTITEINLEKINLSNRMEKAILRVTRSAYLNGMISKNCRQMKKKRVYWLKSWSCNKPPGP
ncbi:MAG: hypothetical protein ACM3X9_14430 [Bacillota bacterium]